MTTTNEMIFKTLKTKADKPARFKEQLEELGYDVKVEKYDNYWSVNGLAVSKWEGETAQLNLGRGQYVEKFENIKKVDFVGYFEKLDARNAKRERMNAHDGIGQEHEYWKDEREFYIADDGTEYRWYKYGCKKVTRRFRHHRTIDRNYTVEEYRGLKRKADAAGWGYWRSEGETDYEIRFAEKMLASAEARVEKLWKELEAAEREVEDRKRRVQKEIDRKAEGGRELDAWLKAKGIRKEVA